MFGLLTDDEGNYPYGRFARRRIVSRGSFRGYESLIAAGLNLTAGIVTLVAKSTQHNAQDPGTYVCPQGFYYEPTTRTCQPVPGQSGAGSFLSNIDPTTLLIGGGLLAVVLLSGRG